MTVKKLKRMEHDGGGPAPHEISNLMYEGMDVEGLDGDPKQLAQKLGHDDGNELYDPYKAADPFDHSDETYGVDPHILKILHAAGVEIDEELAAALPTWEDITSMYGSKPIVYGLETCEPYRAAVKPEDRMIGPAGIFNTGTNLFFELMKVNCDIKEARKRPRREPKHNGMRWQAPVSDARTRRENRLLFNTYCLYFFQHAQLSRSMSAVGQTQSTIHAPLQKRRQSLGQRHKARRFHARRPHQRPVLLDGISMSTQILFVLGTRRESLSQPHKMEGDR
jgi:hypothetical protein